MRRLLPLLTLAAAPASATTPASTSSTPSADPCPTTPPYGYRLEVGYAASKIEAEALATAREKARAALIDKACAGAGELRCASIKRHIHPWADGAYDKKARSACAAMAIQADALGSWEKDLEQLRVDVATLAKAIAAQAGGKPVALDAPRWPSGCVAEDVGPSLAAELRNHLVGAQLRQAGALDVPTVQLTLAPSRDALTVSATWRPAGGAEESPIGGFHVPIDLFDVEADEVGSCRGLASLGLRSPNRPGEGGLEVAVQLATHDGEVCEGEDLAPIVRTSGPADVVVLSVGRDGTAYIVWPPPGGAARATGTLSLGENRAVRAPDQLGDEVLLAIAAPPGGSLGRFGGRPGFCQVPMTFGADLIPPGAAVGSATYTVAAPGSGRSCAPLADDARDLLLDTIASAPPCW